MRDLALAIEGGVLLGCVWALLAICLGVVVVNCLKSWQVWKSKRKSRVMTIASLIAVLVGGIKRPVIVDDPYIRDAGSYVTNDLVHVAVEARYAFVPPSTEVLIWSRELSQTNAEDWVQLVRAEEGPYRLREFPLDIPFPNATNYAFMVAAKYIPEPTIHTNGVWSAKGFEIPGAPGKMAFPNTKTVTKGDTP